MREIPNRCEDRLFIRPVGFRSTKRAAVRYMESYGRKRWREDRRGSPRHSGLWSTDGAGTRDGAGWECKACAGFTRRIHDHLWQQPDFGPVCHLQLFRWRGLRGGRPGQLHSYRERRNGWQAHSSPRPLVFPSRSRLPIILRDPTNCPTNTVTLSIYTDACYPIGPGTPLVSAIATVPAAPCGLAVAKLPNSAPF